MTARASAAARLDRLPITAFHRQAMWLLGLVFFFELGDINTFSFAAPAILESGWFADRVGLRHLLLAEADAVLERIERRARTEVNDLPPIVLSSIAQVPRGFRATTIVIFGFLVAMLLQTFTALVFAYTPECFPTEVRSSGAGLAYGTGRLANVVGPLVIAFIFKEYGYTSVFIYITIMLLLVGVTIAAFWPSTKGRVLT